MGDFGTFAPFPGSTPNKRGGNLTLGEGTHPVTEAASIVTYCADRPGVQAVHLIPGLRAQAVPDAHGELIARLRCRAGALNWDILVDFAAGTVVNVAAEAIEVFAQWRARDGTSWPVEDVAAVVEPGPHPTNREPTLTEPQAAIAGAGNQIFPVPLYAWACLVFDAAAAVIATTSLDFLGGTAAGTRTLGTVAQNQGSLVRYERQRFPGGTRAVRLNNGAGGVRNYVLVWYLAL